MHPLTEALSLLIAFTGIITCLILMGIVLVSLGRSIKNEMPKVFKRSKPKEVIVEVTTYQSRKY